MVLKPEKEKEAEAIFKKWGLDFAVVGYTTPSKRFVVKHGGDVMADLPIKELGDEAPLYDRPHVPSAALPVVHAREVPAPMGLGAALEKLIGTPDMCSKRWVWEQYDHVILGNTMQRPGGDAAVVRVQDGPEGPGADRRRHAALLRGRSLSRRHAGGGGSLAQHHRGRRQAACDHRQSQFRQSRAARDHGPVRRLPEGHLGSLPHARLPGRVRQRLALQRDQRPRDPADALDRRRRPARRLHQVGLARLQGRRRGDPPDRRDPWLARPVRLPARHLRSRGGRAAAGRSRRREAQRRLRARHDPCGHRDRRARSLRWRPADRARRDGDGERHRREAARGADRAGAAGLLVRRGPGALSRHRAGNARPAACSPRCAAARCPACGSAPPVATRSRSRAKRR